MFIGTYSITEMSWAEGREKRLLMSMEEKVANIGLVNTFLTRKANDQDFQDDLNLPIVQKALKHWYCICQYLLILICNYFFFL